MSKKQKKSRKNQMEVENAIHTGERVHRIGGDERHLSFSDCLHNGLCCQAVASWLQKE